MKAVFLKSCGILFIVLPALSYATVNIGAEVQSQDLTIQAVDPYDTSVKILDVKSSSSGRPSSSFSRSPSRTPMGGSGPKTDTARPSTFFGSRAAVPHTIIGNVARTLPNNKGGFDHFDSSGAKIGTTIPTKNPNIVRDVKLGADGKPTGDRVTRDTRTGATIAETHINADGTRSSNNFQTGTSSTWDPFKQKGDIKYASGLTEHYHIDDSGNKIRTRFFGTGIPHTYVQAPTTYRGKTIYVTQFERTSTFDDPWFWLFLASTMSHHDNNPPPASGQNIPVARTDYNYDWRSLFSNIPKDVPTTINYKVGNGFEWMTDYVSYEMINDYSSIPKESWGQFFESAFVTVSLPQPYTYQPIPNVHADISKEVMAVLTNVKDNKPIQTVKDIIDDTGAIKGDGPYTFVFNNDKPVENVKSEDNCSLHAGDAVKLKEGVADTDVTHVEILQSRDKDQDGCAPSEIVEVNAPDLQDMQNDLAERVQRAVMSVSQEKAKGRIF